MEVGLWEGKWGKVRYCRSLPYVTGQSKVETDSKVTRQQSDVSTADVIPVYCG